MSQYRVTVDEESHLITADRCDMQNGAVVFYGNDKYGIYGLLRALAPGTWAEVTRVDD